MNLALQIIQTFENQEEHSPTLTVQEGNKRKKKSDKEIIIEKVLTSIEPNEWLHKKSLLTQIENHTLYIEPPTDVSESYNFGWYRGLAFKLETLIRGRWYSWFNILGSGRLEETDQLPDCRFSMFDGKDEVNKMIENCMNHVYNEGYRVYDFVDWIGYSLGISWFKDKPKISNRLWEKLYDEFDISLLFLHPSDYFSYLLAEHGQSGVGGYFPTPIGVSTMMNKMLGFDSINNRTESIYEPCSGPGAMILPSDSLNLCGTDINPIMVRAASIQAFCYSPWLLYTPIPIIGLHFSEEEMRINKYFEFSTDTRIYCGDSLIGEFTAPRSIFLENSEHIDVYLNALDMEKREVFKYEEIMMTTDWKDLDHETKWNITVAQARELKFDSVISNPPFGKMNKMTMQRIREIEENNKQFLENREKTINQTHPLVDTIEEEIKQDIELKLDEKTGQFQLY